MTDQVKPRRARRLPYVGPIDVSRPRRAESDVTAAMRAMQIERAPLVLTGGESDA